MRAVDEVSRREDTDYYYRNPGFETSAALGRAAGVFKQQQLGIRILGGNV